MISPTKITHVLVEMDVDRIERSAAEAAKLLKVLANPNRLLILCHLAQGEKSVGQLEARMNLTQARLSQELARLRHDGLVRTRRDSRTIHYSIDDSRAESLIRHLYELFCAATPTEQACEGRTMPAGQGNGAGGLHPIRES
jgi:DNA-binding transcriptional ArsR family regulator